MLKVYSLLLTLIVISVPFYIFVFIIQPHQEIIDKQNEELVKLSDKVSSCSSLENTLSAKQKLIDELNLKTKDCNTLVSQKSKEIETLEGDFKKLFDDENKASEVVTWAIVESLPPVSENVLSSIDDIIEDDALSYANEKQLWQVWVPYIKWAEVPGLRELYAKVKDSNIKMKDIIEFACPADYYKDTDQNTIKITTLIKSYCLQSKEENCSEDVKNKLANLRRAPVLAQSKWIQLITKYNKDNPWDYTERSLFYYNNLWARICAWQWTKVWTGENYFKLK